MPLELSCPAANSRRLDAVQHGENLSRDLKAFGKLGHIAIGLDGAAHFVTMARAYSGCEVWHQDLPNPAKDWFQPDPQEGPEIVRFTRIPGGRGIRRC